jgi:NADH-quinone oxidoreductase subunit G
MHGANGLLIMDTNTITLEIDGKQISAQAGALLIDVADANGIHIPRFCYHKKLSVAASCRMCLVDVEKAPKPMPACATPVADGMKVLTQSEKARQAQRSVMEFLLINHPLDCPICDQGGECDLQDITMGFGGDHSRYREPKRHVRNPDLGALVATDMDRCIHCTRCVRFGKEIAGVPELGGIGRSEHMKITTYVKQTLSSPLSANVVDVCPVGALTSKPFRYQARSWELTNTPSIAMHDSLGSNVMIQSYNNQIMRVLPRENDALNEVWLSDRDRFSYTGLNAEDRVLKPLIKNDRGNQLVETDWDTALERAAAGINQALAQQGKGAIGALASPSSTLEEFYLLKSLMNGLDSQACDYRLRRRDFSLAQRELPPLMGVPVAQLENCDAIVLVGSDVDYEIPLLGHRLRKAQQRGARVARLTHVDAVNRLAKALVDVHGEGAFSGLTDLLANVVPSDEDKTLAQALLNGSSMVILGDATQASDHFAYLYDMSRAIGGLSSSDFGLIDQGNAAGAWQAGCVSPQGIDEMMKEVAAMVLLGLDVDADIADEHRKTVLADMNFVVALTAFADDKLNQYADVVLPIASFGETSGTFVNMHGDQQSFAGAVSPAGDARPAWKVLRVLGNRLDIEGFDYMSSEEVKNQCQGNTLATSYTWNVPETLVEQGAMMVSTPIYNSDPLVRRAKPLQATAEGGRS